MSNIVNEEDISNIIQNMDIDGNGHINYSEFLAGSLTLKKGKTDY